MRIIALMFVTWASTGFGFQFSGDHTTVLNNLNDDTKLLSIDVFSYNDRPSTVTMLDDSKKTQFDDTKVIFGAWNTAYISLFNESEQDQSIYLSFFASLPDVMFFSITKNQVLRQSKTPFRYDAASFKLRPGSNTIGVSYQVTVGNVFPPIWLTLDSEDHFLERLHLEGHVHGVIYGVVFTMAIFSLVMYGWFRKAYFFHHFVYTISSMCIYGTTSGYLVFHLAHLYVYSVVVAIYSIIFMNSVLSTRQYAPRYHSFSKVFVMVLLGAITYISWSDYNAMNMLYLGFSTLVYMIVGCIIRLKQGYSPARIYLLGFAVLAVGASLTSLNALVIKSRLLGYSMLFAWMVEVFFFTIAIVYSLRVSERNALRQSLHAFQQLSKIVYPHQILQIKSGIPLEQTMPIHPDKCCVISFDIIASSQIPEEKAKDFFRKVFAECNKMMKENYDPHQLTCNAYRIKELGDGFLCSVGYPMASSESNICNAAMRLSFAFHKLFSGLAQQYLPDQKVFCGIGVAYEAIQGFYPESDPKEYDLFGKAIVLAKRYESLRKFYPQEQSLGSMIIIQSQAFDQATLPEKNKFITINLAEEKVYVRDDKSAKYAHIFFDGRPQWNSESAS